VTRWEERYPRLFSSPDLLHFLSATFCDPREGETDNTLAAYYISGSGPEVRQAILEEGEAVLEAADFPWEEIRSTVNRHLDDEEHTRQWLADILRVVGATAPAPIAPKYPRFFRLSHLRQFLGASFPAWPGGGDAADEAAAKDIAASGPLHRQAILEQGRLLLVEPDLPWQDVRSLTRRNFRNEDETRQWLARILRVVEATEPASARRDG